MARVQAEAVSGNVPSAGSWGGDGSVQSVFSQLESQRLAAIRSFCLTTLVCLVLLPVVVLPLASCIFVMVEHPGNPAAAALANQGRPLLEPYAQEVLMATVAWLFVGLFLLGRLFVRRGRQPCWDYVRDFKTKVFNYLCSAHFPGLAYDPRGYVGDDEFDGTKLFPYTSDEYRSHDYFSGRVGMTDISFAEVVAKRERKHFRDGSFRTYLEEFFSGLVFIADFHKHFHSTTRLIPADQKVARVRGHKPLQLEDPDFNEAFAAVSTDQVDARYVLSTSMARRLVELNDRFPGMRALFRNENLVLALPSSRDMFEPSLYRRASSNRQIEEFVRDIQNLLSIVDELNLNTRIWSKV